jgi:hypothetical protein
MRYREASNYVHSYNCNDVTVDKWFTRGSNNVQSTASRLIAWSYRAMPIAGESVKFFLFEKVPQYLNTNFVGNCQLLLFRLLV